MAVVNNTISVIQSIYKHLPATYTRKGVTFAASLTNKARRRIMKTGKAIAFLLSVIFAIPASAQHKWHIGIGEEMAIAAERRKEKA